MAKNKKGGFREIFSENGVLSSKRVFGGLSLIVSLACIVFLVITEGGTMIVEGLLQTVLIMAASLLGISSVTSIWKQGPNSRSQSMSRSQIGSSRKATDDEESEEEKEDDE